MHHMTNRQELEQQKVSDKRHDQIVKAAVRLFSERGYFQTTIGDIAREADISKGLIYLYFKDKNDVLFYTLRFVLLLYEQKIPLVLEKLDNPLLMLKTALRVYCNLVNDHRSETTLAYRSTKDLLPEQRKFIKLTESKSSRVIRNCLEACIHSGLMSPVNTDIMTYQYIMFSHTWALKHWAFRDKYSFDEYMEEGEKILLDPFLTPVGKIEMEKINQNFSEPLLTAAERLA